jgi:hypothetical protein
MLSAPPESQSFALRLTRGVHQGALIRLRGNGLLVIGASEECDVILADPGIAARHCVLRKQQSGFALRAMDGAVSINGRHHDPGATVGIRVGARVEIGSARFEIADESQPPAPIAPAEPALIATVKQAPIATAEPPPAAAEPTPIASAEPVPADDAASPAERASASMQSVLAELMRQSGVSVWLIAAAAVSIVLAVILLALEFGRTDRSQVAGTSTAFAQTR